VQPKINACFTTAKRYAKVSVNEHLWSKAINKYNGSVRDNCLIFKCLKEWHSFGQRAFQLNPVTSYKNDKNNSAKKDLSHG